MAVFFLYAIADLPLLQQQQQLRPCAFSAAFSGLSSPMKHAGRFPSPLLHTW